MNENLLFHYTNADGAIGIFTNECLWATDIRFLNDSEEFLHGCKLAKEIIAELKREGSHFSSINDFYTTLEVVVGNLNSAVDIASTAYVVSFSCEGDMLNQWRTYGGDSGYALGWNINVLHEIARLRGVRLAKCIYYAAEQRRFVKRIIRKIAWRSRNIDEGIWTRCSQEFIVRYILQKIMPRLKHSAFHEEREWRIVIPYSSSVKFRSGRLGITPYSEFSLKRESPEKNKVINVFADPIRKYNPSRIYVGPSENQIPAKIGIEQLLNVCENEVSSIELSKLPYRHMKK
jgi:hypothetical protein